MITMMVNIIAPHMPILVNKLLFCFKRQQAKKLLTQSQVEKVPSPLISHSIETIAASACPHTCVCLQLFRPEAFQLAVRFPIVLNTIFVTMAYCSGLPLLLPFAFLACVVMYWVEKFALFRVCAKPPNMGSSLAEVTYA